MSNRQLKNATEAWVLFTEMGKGFFCITPARRLKAMTRSPFNDCLFLHWQILLKSIMILLCEEHCYYTLAGQLIDLLKTMAILNVQQTARRYKTLHRNFINNC